MVFESYLDSNRVQQHGTSTQRLQRHKNTYKVNYHFDFESMVQAGQTAYGLNDRVEVFFPLRLTAEEHL